MASGGGGGMGAPAAEISVASLSTVLEEISPRKSAAADFAIKRVPEEGIMATRLPDHGNVGMTVARTVYKPGPKGTAIIHYVFRGELVDGVTHLTLCGKFESRNAGIRFMWASAGKPHLTYKEVSSLNGNLSLRNWTAPITEWRGAVMPVPYFFLNEPAVEIAMTEKDFALPADVLTMGLTPNPSAAGGGAAATVAEGDMEENEINPIIAALNEAKKEREHGNGLEVVHLLVKAQRALTHALRAWLEEGEDEELDGIFAQQRMLNKKLSAWVGMDE